MHDAHSAAAVTVGYISIHFREASAPPFHLAIGNIEGNLQRLATEAPPSEPVTKKLFTLVSMEYPMPQLVEGILMLRQASWSVNVAEQGHAVTSQMMRYHNQYFVKSLVARSLISQARVLFRPTEQEKRVAKLVDEVRKSQKQLVYLQHFTGRELFAGSMCQLLKSRSKAGQTNPKLANRAIFKAHGRQWQQHSKKDQNSYELRAVEVREVRLQKLADKRMALAQELRKARGELDAELYGADPMRLSSARLGGSEARCAFDQMVQAAGSAAGAGEPLRPFEVCQPSAGVKESIEAFVREAPQAQGQRPSCLRAVCVHRSVFRDFIFKFLDADGRETFYKFVYAMISPAYICFACLQRRNDLLHEPEEEVTFVGKDYDFDEIFQIAHLQYIYSTDSNIATDARIEVMDGQSGGGAWLGGRGQWRRLETMLAALRPVRAATNAARAPCKKHKVDRDTISANPWLLDFFGGQAVCQTSQPSGDAMENITDDEASSPRAETQRAVRIMRPWSTRPLRSCSRSASSTPAATPPSTSLGRCWEGSGQRSTRGVRMIVSSHALSLLWRRKCASSSGWRLQHHFRCVSMRRRRRSPCASSGWRSTSICSRFGSTSAFYEIDLLSGARSRGSWSRSVWRS